MLQGVLLTWDSLVALAKLVFLLVEKAVMQIFMPIQAGFPQTKFCFVLDVAGWPIFSQTKFLGTVQCKLVTTKQGASI